MQVMVNSQALDIYKGLASPLESSLKAPLREREELSDVGVNIVKDGVNLVQNESEWLSEAFLSPEAGLL